MSGDKTSQLFQAAALTFEELGFFYAEADLTEAQEEAPVEAAARVRFVGPMTGHVEVRIAGGILGELAANMLGQDQPPGPGTQRDALGELTNVICGNLLPALAGSRVVFDLGKPDVRSRSKDVEEAPDRSHATHVTLGFEGGRAEVLLFLDVAPVGTEIAS